MTDFDGAMFLHREHRLEEAAQAYEEILAAGDAQFEPLFQFSLLRAQQGRFEESLALAEAAAAIRPDSWEIDAHIGTVLLALNRVEPAFHALFKAAGQKPQQPEVYNNLGAALRGLGRLERAREQFETAIRLRPNYVDALENLASTLNTLYLHDEAIEVLERLIATVGRSVVGLDHLGYALWKSGRLLEAEQHFREALSIDPAFARARAHLGNVAVEAGRIDEASEHFLAAIAMDPQAPEYYRFLAQIAPAALTARHRAALESLSQSAIPPHQRAEADFALSRYYDTIGDRDTSFDYLVAANALSRSLQIYNEAETLHTFDATRQLFTPQFLAAFAGHGNQSDIPVFIVGMPRSGTSLVEQVLASHPAIFGAGELALVQGLAAEVFATGVSSGGIRLFGDRYVDAIMHLAPRAARIIDKMPMNFRYVGLIHLALPHAKVVHTRRDALDTCFSCFSQSFESSQLGWTNDLGELGRYYRAYEDLMEHWKSVLPHDAMLEVAYEALIEDFETQARRLVEFLGLPWDDRVLEFHKTERSVKTASAAQVRRPLYPSSVKASRAYRARLGPLMQALGRSEF